MNKHFELWPLSAVVGVALGGLAGFIGWSCVKKDFIITRGRFPWDNLDLLAHPYSRKLRQFNEDYDQLTELDQLYKDMDNRQRQRDKRRKSKNDDCA